MNTYRLEFQREGQVERYLGQVHILYQGHRSKIKVTRSKKVHLNGMPHWEFQSPQLRMKLLRNSPGLIISSYSIVYTNVEATTWGVLKGTHFHRISNYPSFLHSILGAVQNNLHFPPPPIYIFHSSVICRSQLGKSASMGLSMANHVMTFT